MVGFCFCFLGVFVLFFVVCLFVCFILIDLMLLTLLQGRRSKEAG